MKYSVFSSETHLPENQSTSPEVENKIDDNGPSIKSIFKNGFIVTPLLILINIIVFVLMVFDGMDAFEPANEILIKWGANFTPYTLNGERWRLLTCCFIHIGVFHLLMNMIALFSIGFYIEMVVGSFRYILIYLLAGISGSIISLWWHDLTISAGASGAIFGLYGFFLAFLIVSKIGIPERKDLISSTALFVGYNLLNGLRGGIDNAAHIGGLITGLILAIGYYAISKNREDTKIKNLAIVVPSGLILLVGVYLFFSIPNSLNQYEELLKEFGSNEERALKIASTLNPENQSNAQKNLEEGIQLWQQNAQIINQAIQLERLPQYYSNRLLTIKEYNELREEQYKLFKQSLTDSSPFIQKRLEDIQLKIDKNLQKLKEE